MVMHGRRVGIESGQYFGKHQNDERIRAYDLDGNLIAIVVYDAVTHELRPQKVLSSL